MVTVHLKSMSQTPQYSSSGSRGRNLSSSEDEQLCRSWLQVSKDPIKGTDQTKQAFWQSIKNHAECYVPEMSQRPLESVRQRFSSISHLVSKYVGCLAFEERLNKSGMSNTDMIQSARNTILTENNLKSFRIQGCYQILKDEPKFASLTSQQKLNQKRMQNFDTNDNDENQPSTFVRPVGQKKAKKETHKNPDRWEEVIQQLKLKNELLHKHNVILERASELQMLSMETKDLDDIAKQIVLCREQQLLQQIETEMQEETTQRAPESIDLVEITETLLESDEDFLLDDNYQLFN